MTKISLKEPAVRRFVIYALLVGTITGYYSAISDTIPSSGELSWWQIIHYSISNILNDFVFWFMVTIITAYIFTKTWRRAVLYGAAISLYAIIVYLICNKLTPNSGAVFDGVGFLVLAVAAIFGGALGGLIGHVMKKYPIALAALLGFTLFRLHGALPETWQSPIGLARNIFLCVVIAVILGYWAFRTYRGLKKPN